MSPETAPLPPEPGAPELLMKRRAALVLEVLDGARSPAEAAESLGIALPSYYLLEARALEGLVAACEPRARGRGPGEGTSLQALRRENERLRQDLTRTQALARAVQQAVGSPAPAGEAPAGSKGRRRRRASARALRAARRLAPPPPPAPPPSTSPPPA